MIKNKIIFFFIFIFILQNKNCFSETEIFIKVKVDNEIITNHDILKESEYLKLINPELLQLKNTELLSISQNSLINQIIKAKEISKYLDLKKNHLLTDKVLKDLYKRLDFQNKEDFNKTLKQKNIYTIGEIKQKLKIELFWNELIYTKYKDSININEENLIKKIKAKKNKKKSEFLLSEIFFSRKKNLSLNEQILQIRESIKNKGFNNTAIIFSLSQSSKYGGKIGWVDQNNLSKSIFAELNKINIGEYTNTIKVGNNYLILKIEDKRTTKNTIDEKKQLKEMINFETNRQLNQYANIYFNKAKINYSINEI
tara:strand:+ start:186 stop:1121 length:936 start_codon:yes stop_codon:yes gene_type:complete